MRFIFLFISVLLFAFDSNQIKTTILVSTNRHAIVDKKIQKGLSGYVIHNNMIIAKALALGEGNIKYLPLVKLKNQALATPKIMPKKGDSIIFGLYNFRGLIIAPNQNIYLSTKIKYPNITFINSDIFATYFTTKPQKEDFFSFCRDYNVGIIDFILDKEYIVDCESFAILESHKSKVAKYTKPFFATYSKFKVGFFSSKPNDWINYYKSMLKK
jgi:hypothetical protein